MNKNQADLPTEVEILLQNMTYPMSLETLAKTAKEFQGRGGLPQSRPVHHFQFLQWVMQEMEDVHGEVVMEPVQISVRHSSRLDAGRSNEPCVIQEVLNKRCITRVIAKEPVDLNGVLFQPVVTVVYDDKGIELTFGSNQYTTSAMILFNGKSFRTYGTRNTRIGFDDLQAIAKTQIGKLSETNKENTEKLAKMMDHNITDDQARIIMQKIFEKAVIANKMKSAQYPSILNTTQCIKMQEELEPLMGNNNLNLYAILQAGLYHLKGNSQDMISLMPTIAKLNEYIYALTNE